MTKSRIMKSVGM